MFKNRRTETLSLVYDQYKHQGTNLKSALTTRRSIRMNAHFLLAYE